jgi:hypothetical protein
VAAMLVLLMGRIYEVAVLMASGDMIDIPSFINIGTGFRRLLCDRHIETHTDSMGLSHAYFHFLENKGTRLRKRVIDSQQTV